MIKNKDIETHRTLHTFANCTSRPTDQNLQKSAIFANAQPNYRLDTEQYIPYRIDIVLDNECNLDCIGCMRTDIQKNKAIDYSRFVKSILTRNNRNDYQIHFTGGEPLLEWKLIEKIVLNTEVKLPISIYTNLTIFNNEMAGFIKANNIEIHTSIDGLKNENDLIRGYGTFEIITKNIQKLNEQKIKISSITTTLKNENINSIDETFIDLLMSLNVEIWRLNIDYQGINQSPDNIIEKTMFLYSKAIEKGISVEGTWLYPFHNLILDNKNGFCPATKGETIAILPDGKISMCPYSNSSLGTFQDNWNIISEQFNSKKQNLANTQRCNECIIKYYCQTQCLITREENNTNLLDWYCEVYKGLTVKLLNYHIDNGIQKRRRYI